MRKRFRFGVKGRFILPFNICLVARDVRENDFEAYKGWLASIGVVDGQVAGPGKIYITFGD